MKLRWGFLGLAAACGACCAPLIAPLLAGAGLAGMVGGGRLFGLTWDQILCVGLPALGAVLLLALWLGRRMASRRSCDCETSCRMEPEPR